MIRVPGTCGGTSITASSWARALTWQRRRRIRLGLHANPEKYIRAVVTSALIALVVAASIRSFLTFEAFLPLNVDLHIPLDAAQRWLAGGRPYLLKAFEDTSTALPLLYPPWVLPFFGLLTPIPAIVVNAAWSAASVAAAIFACRRLGVPSAIIPALLLWPPFLEGLITGNVAIFMFAAFVSVFWEPNRPGYLALPRDLGRRPLRAAIGDGCRALFVAAFKVSQVHSWLYVLRTRPRPALVAAAIGGLVLLVTLPIVGSNLWLDWLEQVRRASEPDIAYPSLVALIGRLPAAIVAGISLAAIATLPRQSAGAWVGVLTVIVSPNLHTHGLLFLLPAMLLLRREFALLAAAGLAANDAAPMWLAILLIAWSLAAAPVWPVLWERRPLLGQRRQIPTELLDQTRFRDPVGVSSSARR